MGRDEAIRVEVLQVAAKIRELLMSLGPDYRSDEDRSEALYYSGICKDCGGDRMDRMAKGDIMICYCKMDD